jgi:predicted PurR-regulated permease PerM
MGTTTEIQNNWNEKFTGALGGVLTSTVQTTVNTLFILFLTPVYTALFMYHRKILVQYLKMITPGSYQQQLDIILQQTIHTYFNYIKGMILVYLIVGVLNSIGLFALGVDHAILFGMICAIMTIIPYVGIFISALLPISVVWLETGNIWYPLGVIAVFGFVQYLEANVIFPKVVGTQLHVSTLAMLVAIIAGGIIWGVAGMVLFIPFAAILKIISDNIEGWKPINLLLSRK